MKTATIEMDEDWEAEADNSTFQPFCFGKEQLRNLSVSVNLSNIKTDGDVQTEIWNRLQGKQSAQSKPKKCT